MKRFKRWLTALGMGAAAVACLLVFTAGPSMGGGTTVRATGADRWSPARATVGSGARVVWRNASGDDHNVVSYAGRWNKSSSLNEGASTSFRFRRAGTYKYRCTLHSSMEGRRCEGMCGKIVVN